AAPGALATPADGQAVVGQARVDHLVLDARARRATHERTVPGGPEDWSSPLSSAPVERDELSARLAEVFDRAAPTYDTVIPFFDTLGRRLVELAAPSPGSRVL